MSSTATVGTVACEAESSGAAVNAVPRTTAAMTARVRVVALGIRVAMRNSRESRNSTLPLYGRSPARISSSRQSRKFRFCQDFRQHLSQNLRIGLHDLDSPESHSP